MVVRKVLEKYGKTTFANRLLYQLSYVGLCLILNVRREV